MPIKIPKPVGSVPTPPKPRGKRPPHGTGYPPNSLIKGTDREYVVQSDGSWRRVEKEAE